MKNILSAILFLSFVSCSNASVVCGGVDDTTALQSAINTAQTTGDELTLPSGDCRAKSTLNITSRIRVRGVGYQGDLGGGFAGHGITQSSGFLGSVLICDMTTDCLVATTDYSVQIQDLQVTYPSSTTGIGITIKALPGAGHANTQSFIKNVMVTGGASGIFLENCLNYHVSHNHVLYQITYGMIVNSPNFPSYQQAFITENMFWGAGNSGYQSYLLVQAGGDLIISNNKGSGGGVNTNGFALFGAPSGSQNMEPMVISGNSIEGPQNCITINTGNASFGVSQVVITGNQLWGGGRALLVNGFGSSQYLIGFTFSANVVTVNGGAGKLVVQIDGAKTGVMIGNVFNLAGGGSGSTGFYLGSHTSGINVQSNAYDSGISTKVNNLGTGNTIGGGSS